MENKSINIKLNCLVKMSQAEAREHINNVLEAISSTPDGLLSSKNYVSKDKSDEIEEILLTFKSASSKYLKKKLFIFIYNKERLNL